MPVRATGHTRPGVAAYHPPAPPHQQVAIAGELRLVQLLFLGMLACCCVAAEMASSADPAIRADVEHVRARLMFYVLLTVGFIGTVATD